MSGLVTGLPPAPTVLAAPWSGVAVGDAWSLTLSYESATAGIPSGPQMWFRGFVRGYDLSIGSVRVVNTLPGNFGASQAFVRDGQDDYLGFDFAILEGPLRFGVGLTDLDATAFSTNAVLPTGLGGPGLDAATFDIRNAGVWNSNGGSPAAALQMSVLNIVPAPGTVVLLGGGCLYATRRRRTPRI